MFKLMLAIVTLAVSTCANARSNADECYDKYFTRDCNGTTDCNQLRREFERCRQDTRTVIVDPDPLSMMLQECQIHPQNFPRKQCEDLEQQQRARQRR
jgi:hypothetical protein